MPRTLTWRAVYHGDESLSQYNADGSENKYADIERHRLTRFDLLDGETPVYSLYPRYGQRLIFRKRNFITLGPNGQERHRIYLVGWQMTVMTLSGPKNITALNYLLEDGSIMLDGDRDNIEYLPEEL